MLHLNWTYSSVEVGGFYNYDGVWTSLSNQISAWITDYTANLTYNYDF